ncbi:MAG: hypothetical protein WC010_04450 [Candidatus Absconditabacterales bacterium]
MSLIPNKRKKEEEIGIFFTNRYNKKYNTAYDLCIDEEDRDIDCLMRSKIDDKHVGLQITTYDSVALETLAKHQKKPNKVICFNPERVKCVKKAIVKKNNGIINNNFLLIWSDGLTGFNYDYIKEETLNECGLSNYKKIYLVKMPNNGIPKNESNEGEIIELK